MRLPLTVDCPASAQRQRSNSDSRQQPNKRREPTAARSSARVIAKRAPCHAVLLVSTHTLSLSDALSLTVSPSYFVLYLEELPTGIFLFSAANRFWLLSRTLIDSPKLRCHCDGGVAAAPSAAVAGADVGLVFAHPPQTTTASDRCVCS